MPLVQGSRLADRRIPSLAFINLSFNNTTTGSDQWMFITVACPATSVAGVNVAGTPSTLVQRRSTPYSTDWTTWRFQNPPAGNITIYVVMNAANYNGVSTFIQVFSGCSGVGNTAYNGVQSLPTTTNLTIQQNSMVIGSVIGGNATNANIEIPINTARTLLYNHNINNFTWGSVSPSLSAGTITLEGNSTATMIIMATEVREAVSVVVPTLTTTAASAITQTTATSGGTSINAGGGTITAKGVCWSTSTNPTIANSNTNNGTGTANFTSSITGLLPNTTYYVRAYATNSAGTGYGNQISFTTLPLPTRRIIIC